MRSRLAQVYASENILDLAIDHAEKALFYDKNSVVLSNNLASYYRRNGDVEKAISLFKKSLNKNCNDYNVMLNLGQCYLDKMWLLFARDEFLKVIHRADSNSKVNHLAHYFLSQYYFLIGNLEQGWSEHEHRHYVLPQLIAIREVLGNQKQWGGYSDLKDKKVLVFCEQGLGDAIQFIRYMPKLKEKGCKTILVCDKSLRRLMSSRNGVDKAITNDELLEKTIEFDYYLPLMSLPYLLNNYVINTQPYINSRKMGLGFEEHVRVGICWKGNPNHCRDKWRSMKLKEMIKLIPKECKTVSLVKDISEEEKKICKKHNILELSDFMTDFEETAQIIADMDLIVSVDTAILHLAGALGKKTLGIIPFRPDFRWGCLMELKWYENLQLLRKESK